MRATMKQLIVEDLGYCCPWFFFQCFKRTSVIAARLGYSTRHVRRLRSSCENGEETCRGCGNCKKDLVKKIRWVRKQ